MERAARRIIDRQTLGSSRVFFFFLSLLFYWKQPAKISTWLLFFFLFSSYLKKKGKEREEISFKSEKRGPFPLDNELRLKCRLLKAPHTHKTQHKVWRANNNKKKGRRRKRKHKTTTIEDFGLIKKKEKLGRRGRACRVVQQHQMTGVNVSSSSSSSSFSLKSEQSWAFERSRVPFDDDDEIGSYIHFQVVVCRRPTARPPVGRKTPFLPSLSLARNGYLFISVFCQSVCVPFLSSDSRRQ